jgi:hypothetical protein
MDYADIKTFEAMVAVERGKVAEAPMVTHLAETAALQARVDELEAENAQLQADAAAKIDPKKAK